MRKLVLAALAAVLLPAAAHAAEEAHGWVIDFHDGNLRLLGDAKIYVVPSTIDTEGIADGQIAHLTYEPINGALVVQDIRLNDVTPSGSD